MIKKTLTIGIGFFLMYAGFTMLLLPMIISTSPMSLNLSDTPQTFGFENNLSSVDSIYGNPKVVASPVDGKGKVLECQSGDYVRWNLAAPSNTLDLSFKTYWTEFPTTSNESLSVGEIYGLDKGMWQDIFSSTLYCNSNGYRGWSLWTGIPNGRISYVSGDVVYALEINRWYTIRMTADLNTGTYKLYLDGTELASITGVIVSANVNVGFFRLGAGSRGNSDFTTYYDEITASFLDPSPPPNQWSVRITSTLGGSTSPVGITYVNKGENLNVNAEQTAGYVFSKWVLDGVDYSINSTVILSAQSPGTAHTLHATFKNTNKEPNPYYNSLPLQLVGLGMIIGGGYVLWSWKKRESSENATSLVNSSHT